MKRAAPLSLLLTILFLAPTIFTVLPASASTQSYQSNYNIEIVSWGPTTGAVGQSVTLYARVTVGGQPASAQVTFSSLYNGELDTVFTDSTGLAQSKAIPFVGSDTITATAFVKVVGQTVEKSWTISVSGAATSTPQQPTATPSAATPAPQATVVKPTVPPTPTQQQPVINIYVPPPTVITQTFPGTVTQGTGPWGDPRVTVTNPGPDKLRTTLIDFAKNPEDNTAHYNEQVSAAKAGGWTLTAQGEKTYGDHSKDTRYSRFVKGGNTLNFSAQGNNSTDKQYAIPGDVLITDQNETFSSGTAGFSLFGLEGLAAYAVVAVIVIVVAALIVVGALYYDNRRRNRGADQQQDYPRR